MNSISVLKSEHYKKTAWKNGLGITQEIEVFPDPSETKPFVFRLSDYVLIKIIYELNRK